MPDGRLTAGPLLDELQAQVASLQDSTEKMRTENKELEQTIVELREQQRQTPVWHRQSMSWLRDAAAFALVTSVIVAIVLLVVWQKRLPGQRREQHNREVSITIFDQVQRWAKVNGVKGGLRGCNLDDNKDDDGRLRLDVFYSCDITLDMQAPITLRCDSTLCVRMK